MSYTIPAPNHTPQHMKILGDAFDLKLQSPGVDYKYQMTSTSK